MHSHGGMYGGGALGSQRCGSHSGTGNAVVAQRAMAIAFKTYDEDESRERERWEERWIGLATVAQSSVGLRGNGGDGNDP